MSQIKLDDEIPFPGGQRERADKYPWESMNPGQSFFVPGGKMSTFYSNCRKMGQKYEGREFRARDWEQEQEGGAPIKGVRVWRVK